MRVLIITCAGMSTRFSKSVGYNCLKCIYSDKDIKQSILYKSIMNNVSYFDKIIIVGGFKFDDLNKFINKYFEDLKEKIILVDNKMYAKYGSGYSFWLGLKQAFDYETSEIVFMEGDLYINEKEFKKMCEINNNIVTTNYDEITASKAVAFYIDLSGKIHYIYDTKHNALQIDEPFFSIRNSGQIWKFIDIGCLRYICNNLLEEEKKGTNLVIIQKYFEKFTEKQYIIFNFKEWINCNTINDYKLTVRQSSK